MLWEGGTEGCEPKVRAGGPGCARGGGSATGCRSGGRRRGGVGGAQAMLAHGVERTRHPFVLHPAPPLTFRGPPCHHPQPPSMRGSAPPGPQCPWSGAEAGVVGGGSRLCHRQEMGTRHPRGTGARREGADQHQSKRVPLSIHPCCQVSPCWSVPGGSFSPAAPVAIPPWPQPPPQHQPGPRHPWGIPAAPGAPWTPTTGLEHPWPAEVETFPPLPPSHPELVEQPPRPRVILPLASACLPGSVCPSVCLSRRAQLTHGLASPPWCEQGWGSRRGRALRTSSSGGPEASQLGHSPAAGEGMGDAPACQSRPARWVLPARLVRAGSGHPGCPAEVPRL